MADSNPTTDITPPPSPRQVLLGGFIVFQITFLIVANLLGFVMWAPNRTSDQPRRIVQQAAPDFANKQGHGWEWCTEVETCVRRWTQLTLQDQQWALFAPNVSKATGFPCVLLVWDDVDPEQPFPPETKFEYDAKNGIHLSASWNPPSDRPPPPGVEVLLSKNEPANIDSYLRISNCRVRKYEGVVYLHNLHPSDDEEYDHLAGRLTDYVRDLVKDYPQQTHAYMRWRLNEWRSAHPGQAEPKQVLLFERYYRIQAPSEGRGWQRALYPVARWQPVGQNGKSSSVLEYFDYRDKRFYPAK